MSGTPPLSDDYCASALRDARRFSGTYDQGTSGTLAAHTARLLKERERLLTTIQKLENENAAMRSAVKDRIGEQMPGTIDLEQAWGAHKARHQETMKAAAAGAASSCRVFAAKPPAEAAVSPAEELCQKTSEVIRDRRPKYGGPRAHFARTVGMVNAAFSGVLKRPLTEADWATIMILDKVARYMGPTSTVDGPIDIAGYAACLYEVSQPE